MRITICGSMTFHSEMEKIGQQLRKNGHDVKVPLLRIDVKEKADAIDDHFAKVAWSDAILVVNYPKHEIDGYVGGNTLMEIAVAYYLKKKIYLLLPVSYKLPYKEEILGMRPIIIQENLSLLDTVEEARWL